MRRGRERRVEEDCESVNFAAKAVFQMTLLRANPRPNIPALPVSRTVVSVSLMAANSWLLTEIPAKVTVSEPITPAAWVPVSESP